MLDYRYLLAGALLLAGCVKPILRPYPERTAQSILDEVRAQAAAITTVRASARVEHDGPGLDRVKISVTLFAVRGGKLRVDAEGPMGGALATLVADGTTFSMLDVRENRFLSGPAEPCNVARLLQVALAPAEIADILLGGAPLSGEPTSITWDPKKGHEVLELQRADQSRLRLRVAPRNGKLDLVGAELLAPDGGVLHRVQHESFTDRDKGVRFPERTTVRDLLRKKTLYLRWRDVEPNVEPPPAVFQLPPPPGIPHQQVTCDVGSSR